MTIVIFFHIRMIWYFRFSLYWTSEFLRRTNWHSVRFPSAAVNNFLIETLKCVNLCRKLDTRENQGKHASKICQRPLSQIIPTIILSLSRKKNILWIILTVSLKHELRTAPHNRNSGKMGLNPVTFRPEKLK